MNLMMVTLLSVSVHVGLSQDWVRAGACLLLAGLALACPCYHNNNRLILWTVAHLKNPAYTYRYTNYPKAFVIVYTYIDMYRYNTSD